MASTAEPGSDAQLAFTRAWTAVAASPEHLDDLQALLETTDGGTVLPGIDVDTDLRWSLLHRLVILGAVGPDAIDAELARDDTATGRRQAAYARAARPTEQAKEEAWAQVVETDELPNALVFAAVEGFAQPEQHELVRPYVGRYLDAVPRVWSERTSDIARTIITRLFPRILSDQTTADTVRAWLDHAEAPPTPSTRCRRSRRSRPRATRPGLRSRGGDVRTPLTARRAVGSRRQPAQPSRMARVAGTTSSANRRNCS